MNETWMGIPGYRNYAVSELGRIKRVTPGMNTFPDRLLKPPTLNSGYRIVFLRGDDNTVKGCLVHVLVARAFIGICPKGKEVNHKDGDKANNRPGNLEYVTCKENQEHASRLGLKARGNRQGSSKLTPPQVVEIRNKIAAGSSHISIADEYKVTPTLISLIKHGHVWSWLK